MKGTALVTPLAYYDLIEMFPKPGCAICNLLQRDVNHFLDSLLYERVNEADTHKAFRAAHGLCNQHAWQLTHYKGQSLGVAILYAAALDEVLKTVANTPESMPLTGLSRLLSGNVDSSGKTLADNLEPQAACLACRLLAESENGYVQVLCQHFSEGWLHEAYRASSGLCLSHFQQVIRQPQPVAQLRQIVDIQMAHWTQLHAELTEFIDKNRHDRAHEEMGSERDSWLRAIRQMAGAPDIFGPEPREP